MVTCARFRLPLAGLLFLAALSAEAEGQGLFGRAGPEVVSPVPTAAVSASSSGPAEDFVLRTRTATVDLEALARVRAATLAQPDSQAIGQAARAAGRPETLILNLFGDTVFTGTVKYTAPTYSGGYSVSAGLAEDPLGSVTLVVNEDRVLGTVRSVEGIYRIRTAGDGLLSISQIQEAPFECEVVTPHSMEEHLEHLH